MTPVRILIADDSAVIRRLYREVLTADGRFEIVAEAESGDAAVAACERFRPQVVAMDIEMPGINGLEATREIMKRCPTPVVIVSNALSGRQCRMAMESFRAGAVEVVPKPDLTDRTAGMRAVTQLTETLKMMSTVRLMRRAAAGGVAASSQVKHEPVSVIGLGASTGGPEAVRRLLSLLPVDFPVPLLIVQHMMAEFLPGLAEWLDNSVPLPVRMAAPGPLPVTGQVLLAPGDQHLRVDRGRLTLGPRLGKEYYCPSVDVLFDSLAAMGPKAAAVLLTGMGADGAAGMAAMKAAGGMTMAQDEASSVVWGMPGVAIQRGAADLIGSPETLAACVLALKAGPASF